MAAQETRPYTGRTTTTTHKILDCPACGKPITARLLVAPTGGTQAERAFGPLGSQEVSVSANVLGLALAHDCIPIEC